MVSTAHAAATVIDARASAAFELLRDPATHRHFDGSAMVGEPTTAEILSGVGQVFTMNMTYIDGDTVEHYLSDNILTMFDLNRTIAWTTAVHGGSPLGWTWRYDLAPTGGGTRVRLTYDWSDAPAATIRRFGVPLVGPDRLAESLRLLAALCASAQ